MKLGNIPFFLAVLTPIIGPFYSGAQASVLASETFNYGEDTPLAGRTGGSGWAGAWTRSTNGANGLSPSATIKNEGVVFGDGPENPFSAPANQPNAHGYAARSLQEPYAGDVVFLKYVVSLGDGTTVDPDRFYLQMVGPVTDGDQAGPEVGLGLSQTNQPDLKFSARLLATAGESIVTPGPDVSEYTTYVVVVELSKSTTGPANPYDTLRLWVNPKSNDYDTVTPQTVARQPGLLATIQGLRVCLANTDEGDVFRVEEILFATAWADLTDTK